MSLPTTFSLKSGDGKTIQIPSVGFGTWAAEGGNWCRDATLAALKAGYRHLDCAWMYGVDGQVGEAIRDSGIPRSEIFVTTKFWGQFGAPENVELCLDKCLKGMGLDYVDLYLAHWPIAAKPVSREALEKAIGGPGTTKPQRGMMEDSEKMAIVDWEYSSSELATQAGKSGSLVPTWEAMKKLVQNGKARSIGVSNYSISDLKEIIPHAQDVPIACNQIEAHPWLPNTELINFMKEHNIVATCYSPFAGQNAGGKTLIKDATVIEIAEKSGMDVGQCLQSWAVQRGTIPLGKSQTESRIKSNLDVKKLSPEDVKALDDLEIPNGMGRSVGSLRVWGVDVFSR